MKKIQLMGWSAMLAALCLIAPQAQAIPLQFELTGSYAASWQLDSHPTPSYSNAYYFLLTSVAGTFADVAGTEWIEFYGVGGLGIGQSPTTRGMMGQTLFSGAPGSPTFLQGSFALTSFEGTAHYTLTISEIAEPSQVPEPASLALVLGGLGLLARSTGKRRCAG